MGRGDVEQALEFAGLLVFACPAKRDAKETMTVLADAACRCVWNVVVWLCVLGDAARRLVMITGDATLTAAAVAKDVALASSSKPSAVLRLTPDVRDSAVRVSHTRRLRTQSRDGGHWCSVAGDVVGDTIAWYKTDAGKVRVCVIGVHVLCARVCDHHHSTHNRATSCVWRAIRSTPSCATSKSLPETRRRRARAVRAVCACVRDVWLAQPCLPVA
jgi:hypothetical protein